jgi:subtilisin family serine protease
VSSPRKRTFSVAGIVSALLLTTLAPAMAAAGPSGHGMSVIVRTDPGAGRRPEGAVRALGGQVHQRISLVHSFVATVPARALTHLRAAPGVVSVSPNARVTLSGQGADGHDVAHDLGSMYAIRTATGAGEYWNDGWTGAGVDVAVIDSGVVPVEGLSLPGKVVNGPDLSFESQDTDLRYLDTFGHGTHMAGIIAGRDTAARDDEIERGNEEHFLGIAPDARIVSVKVADAFGATDVSQILAAIDWVVEHRRDDGLDIRVLNLSFGTDGTQPYTIDPLAYAVEVAWRKGIFVVVAAGNEGYGSPALNNPAYDPFVMAVGAADGNGTYGSDDDVVASFSSHGTKRRRPDLLAPGKSVVSLRAPGSFLDLRHPGARVGDTPRFFRGSGTSQAAAVVSGAAALVIQQRPLITPDELKRLLTRTAYKLPKAHMEWQGAGMVDLKKARDTRTQRWLQPWTWSDGTGTLEGARGTYHLENEGVVLRGERDIFGRAFVSSTWARASADGTAWDEGRWLGRMWTGDCWCAETWAGSAWSGRMWTHSAWSGRMWTSSAWSGRLWTGGAWTGGAWTGRLWTSSTWSGNVWSGAGWGP